MGQGVLTANSELLRAIAAAVGTPTFVYDLDAIGARWRELTRAIDPTPHRVHYSVKANGNLALLAFMRELGAGADIVSGGELARTALAGFDRSDIVFSGVGKTRAEIAAAVTAGVGSINVESEEELAVVADTVDQLGTAARIGIRVNPAVTADTHPYTMTGDRAVKFGVPLDRVVPVAERIAARPGLMLTSVGMHIGSQISDTAAYREGAARLIDLATTLRDRSIAPLDGIDLGGGMAVSYAGEPAMTAESIGALVAGVHEATGLRVLLEPGRYLVGAAGVLLARVLYRKHSGGKDFVIVDAGMNDFLRPSYYSATHPISVVAEVADGGVPVVDVVGPICETGDFLGHDRNLPGAGAGALLAVGGAGAYGFSMGSTYNARARPAEVVCREGKFAVARARQPIEDTWRGECTEPEWRTAGDTI